MIIHEHIPKRKKKKPNAKQRALRENWENILAKYETKPSKKVKKELQYNLEPKRATKQYESVERFRSAETVLTHKREYTGSDMIGIATMHKSSAVPIFRTQDAIEVAKMRR